MKKNNNLQKSKHTTTFRYIKVINQRWLLTQNTNILV